MTDAVVKVMVEVLRILAIVTKEIKQSRTSESVPATDPLPPESAYRFLETFVKKLAGRTDIEDALQRLETVTAEEARMAGAEALKAIHGVGDGVQGIHDAVKAVEDRVRGVEEKIQGVDDRVKGIGDMVVLGAQKILNLSSLSSIFIPSGVDKTGRQMVSNPGAIDAESLKTTNEANLNTKIEYVDNMTQGSIRVTLEGTSDDAGNADSVHGPIKDTEARGVQSAHIIRNLIRTTPERLVDIGTAKICQPIASKVSDQSRSLSQCAFFGRRALRYSHSDAVETRGCGLAISARSVCELLHCP